MMRILSKRIVMFGVIWFITNVQAFADSSFSENGFTYKLMKDSCSLSLISYEPVTGHDYSLPLHIPSSVKHEGKTFSVKRIETEAFKDVTEIRSIVIDEGIESLGHRAFECCVNLESVYIPASLERMGERLFGCCSSLRTIKVNEKNECFDSRDESNAIIYSEDDELRAACSFTMIPASVKTIGSFAFYCCTMMENLIIPEGVVSLEDCAFYRCSSLRSVSLPESLTTIGQSVFEDCYSLTSIFVPKNVTQIWEGNLFTGCYNLNSIVVDKSNPYYDSRSNCNGIVRKSDSTLVSTCRSTTIGDDISALGRYCFDRTVIRSINIPKNVTSISKYAFGGCYGIEQISVSEDNPNYSSPKGSNALLSKDGKTLILGCYTTIIPESVEKIGDDAFKGRFGNPVLLIPKKVNEIGNSAFSGCNTINQVVIPNTVKRMGSHVFSNCDNLYVVQLLTPIPIMSGTFSECHSLSVVSLPGGLESIGKEAFKGCRNLEQISIPSSVQNIDKSAFEDCPVDY